MKLSLALFGIKKEIKALREREFTNASDNVIVKMVNFRITSLQLSGLQSPEEVMKVLNDSFAEQEAAGLALIQ
jgi:hypothetical protein